MFRHWLGVVRSHHSTSSVLLLGQDAEAIAANHDSLGWAVEADTKLNEHDPLLSFASRWINTYNAKSKKS